MTKRMSITSSQVAAICRGAAREGFVAELVIDGVTVRLLPEHLARPDQKPVKSKPTPEELLEDFLASQYKTGYL